MTTTPPLTPVAALLAGLLLISGPGLAASASQSHRQATTPCLASADLIDQYLRAGLPLEPCIRARQAADGTASEPCLVVADRVEQWLALSRPLPSCVRRIECAANRHR